MRVTLLVAGAVLAASPGCSPPPLARVSERPGESTRFAGVQRLLQSAVEAHAFPGAVLHVGFMGRVVYATAVGQYGDDDPRPVTDSTVYDLASLTKVVGLTTVVMLLATEAKIDLNRPVADYLPRFSGADKDRVLVRHLLTHSSGLPAWRPLHLETATPEEALDSVLATQLESRPGEAYRYSDLGAITLGLAVERIAGQSLDVILQRRVFGPLGMDWTRYCPPQDWIDRIAPTEDDPWRGRVVRGEVHDENAVRLGGVSAHAGLFSIAPDLGRFAQWMLDAYHGRLTPDSPLHVPTEIVRDFVRRQAGPEGSTRALGWDTPSGAGSSAGTMMSADSFGHTGFTGTSLWIDPRRELFIVLLTNRVHPTRDNNAIRQIRGMVADSVIAALTPPQ